MDRPFASQRLDSAELCSGSVSHITPECDSSSITAFALMRLVRSRGAGGESECDGRHNHRRAAKLVSIHSRFA
jgi:hypothetical protein